MSKGKKDLLEELKAVHQKMQNPENWEIWGICDEIDESNRPQFRVIAQQWDRYSGQSAFPVPGIYMYYATNAKEQQEEEGRMWNREESEYAALRWELLEFAIAKLEG